jgi:hypothetical protein
MSNLRRAIAGLVGIPLLLVTLTEAYFQSFGFYAEHYTFPMEKFGVRTPLRWQDIAFLAVFWPTAVALIYVSYRLLKCAFRREHPASEHWPPVALEGGSSRPSRKMRRLPIHKP